MLYRIVVLICFLSLGALPTAEARHIVGGDITYRCMGNGVYEFTMKIYRDPFGAGADFDNPASIGIYRCGNTVNCGALSTFNIFQQLSVFVDQVTIVENPTYPCLTIPPNIRVDEAIYRWSVNLPPSDESYYIVYQRCCRNNTINNIFNPEDAGATFSVEITPLAQQVCNSSPVFTGFPPTVICAGEPINFLHDAVDPDGDQIVYEFCAPLDGGGPITTSPAAQGCNGVIPTPPCPPPYPTVNYIAPDYTGTAPLGGNPVVTIDPVTGLISGVPEVLGQFVVGVCIYEYRNGQLLSVIRRDFQFNVTNCQPTVVADIQKDDVIGPKAYLLNSCGNNTITFIDRSFQPQNIFAHQWTFDIPGNPFASTERNPTVTFPGPGQYQGQLVVNPNSACSDSATIFVNVFPELEADFSFAYDTCIAGEVVFTDLSQAPGSNILSWQWDFDGVGQSQLQNPAYLFATPGEKVVSLTITDDNNCTDDIEKPITWFPVPPLLIIEPSTFLGCVPATIFFNNLSTPIDESYDIQWTFGDGGTGSAISPEHTYTEPGLYSVTLEIVSPIGCRTEASFSNWIQVEPSPTAAFTFAPTQINSLNPEVRFTDQSTAAAAWFWQFGESGSSTQVNPTFVFPDTGLQTIVLTVTHASGCQDTAVALIDVVPVVKYFLPNAFTPNGDGQNDFFVGRGLLDGMQDFEMKIFNRWGEEVFLTNDPAIGWDGTYRSSSEIAPPGVYAYIVSYSDSRGNKISLQGFAVLVL
jgi:gliding motility-associated-like protein